MILSPYHTTACRAYKSEDILKAVRMALVEDELIHNLETPSGNSVSSRILGVGPLAKDIPAFSHPLPVYPTTGETNIPHHIAVDLRGLIRMDREKNVRVVNATEYEFTLMRAMLSGHWMMEDPYDLVNTGEIAPMVFSRWLSQSIVRRLGLSPVEQVRATVVSVFYWYCLFNNHGKASGEALDENDKRRIVTKLNSITQIPSTLSFEIADQITHMNGLADYIEVLKQVVESPRLDRFNVGVLISLLGGSWFGFNAREVVAVAVEHPPTFLAIIYIALKDRSYRKSTLGSLTYDYDKRDRGREFQRNIAQLIEGHWT